MTKAIDPVLWARFFSATRKFFEEREFLEVFTPTLLPCGAVETTLDCLKVTGKAGTFELPTSPEIEMKRFLASNPRPIFQIARSYRDDPASNIHLFEFFMLEFYKPQANVNEMQQLTQELFQSLSGKPIPFVQKTVSELFFEAAQFRFEDFPEKEAFRAALREKADISGSPDDSWDDLFFRLWISKVEPNLPKDTATVVTEYPPSQAALAALDPTGRFAERFEIYFKEMELCNGCTELLDANALKRRVEITNDERTKAGKSPHPFPTQLIEAMNTLPPCAGVAVGMERLYWALYAE